MISFNCVNKSYPGHRDGDTLRTALAFRRLPSAPFVALKDISFHLEAGQALGVIGANGAGKSTLLKLLTRVSRPTSGSIAVRGRMSSLLEVGAGFHRDLSGWENIYLAGAILGMSPRAVGRHFDEIVAFAGLETHIATPVRTYSSGMFLRLAFSVGIHLESDILVIDEALAVGDAAFQAQCMARIQDFRSKGGTLVLVSHSADQLRAVCDRGLLLDKGRVTVDSDLEAALTRYEQG